MPGTTAGYIITAQRDDGKSLVMAIDAASGGYEYFTTGLSSAAVYETEALATKDLAKRMGSTLLHNATGADYANPRRSVVLSICRVELHPVATEEHAFEVPNPPASFR